MPSPPARDSPEEKGLERGVGSKGRGQRCRAATSDLGVAVGEGAGWGVGEGRYHATGGVDLGAMRHAWGERPCQKSLRGGPGGHSEKQNSGKKPN
jgi:hypothetical protein